MKIKIQRFEVGMFVILSNGRTAHIEEIDHDEDGRIGYWGSYDDGAEIYFYDSNVHAICPEGNPKATVGGS